MPQKRRSLSEKQEDEPKASGMAQRGHGDFRVNTNADHTFLDRVGGVVPGYGGYRPQAFNTAGESAFGRVPQTMEMHRPPGQGTTIGSRQTTAHQEHAHDYKPHNINRTELFKEAVAGVKVCAREPPRRCKCAL